MMRITYEDGKWLVWRWEILMCRFDTYAEADIFAFGLRRGVTNG